LVLPIELARRWSRRTWQGRHAVELDQAVPVIHDWEAIADMLVTTGCVSGTGFPSILTIAGGNAVTK
jgi:hypothetical protein